MSRLKIFSILITLSIAIPVYPFGDKLVQWGNQIAQSAKNNKDAIGISLIGALTLTGIILWAKNRALMSSLHDNSKTNPNPDVEKQVISQTAALDLEKKLAAWEKSKKKVNKKPTTYFSPVYVYQQNSKPKPITWWTPTKSISQRHTPKKSPATYTNSNGTFTSNPLYTAPKAKPLIPPTYTTGGETFTSNPLYTPPSK